MFITIVFSCRKDEITYSEDIVVIQASEDGEVFLQGHITDVSKASVAGAQVIVGDQTVTTDEYGFFLMENASVLNGNITISIVKENFITQYRKILIGEGMEDAFVRASLLSNQNTNHTFESNQTSTITGNGGHKVTFVSNSIVRENGSDYNGTVHFSSYFIDPTRSDLAYIMPGDLSAINLQGEEVQLVSFGMLYGDLTTPTGEPLHIKEGNNATIELEIQSTQLENAPQQIPLWSLDEQSATWLEEGIAIKQGNKYIAKVSHFSFWNCDAPYPVVEVTGYAYNQDGLPISNTTIFVTVPGVGDTRFCSTDRNGCFYGKFPKDEDMIIGVYNDCDEEALLPFGPFSGPTNAGEFQFDISKSGFLIEGTLQNCDLQPLHPGFVEITDNEGHKILAPTVEDGSFYISFFSCDDSNITIKGIDPATLNTSEEIVYELTEGLNNLNNINVCDQQIGDYFNISIDGQLQFFSDPAVNRVGDRLVINGINTEYSVNIELEESDVSDPIKFLTVFLADGTSVLSGQEELNDFIAFSSTAEGGVGEEVSGSLSGEYQGVQFESIYNLTVAYELTPISGMVWEDYNQNGIRDLGEPPISGVLVNFEFDWSTASTPIIVSRLTDQFGMYSFYGSHLSVNEFTIEVPTNYFLTDQNVGSNFSVDSDYNQVNGMAEVTVLGPGMAVQNIDAGIHQSGATYCDMTNISDPCTIGDGDLCKEIVATEAGASFSNIIVEQNGLEVLQTGPVSSPYSLCGLSLGTYRITAVLDNGVECVNTTTTTGDLPVETLFYVTYTNCDPLVANVTAIANQDGLLAIDYEWSNGIMEQTVSMTEGQTLSVTSTDAFNCERTYDYTMEKHNLAVGGVAWIDSENGDEGILDVSDLERFRKLWFRLYNSDDDVVASYKTGESGVYQFYLDVPPGDYYIEVGDFSSLYEIVEPNMGTDDTKDSEFDPLTKRTDVFTVTGDCQQIDNLNVGITKF